MTLINLDSSWTFLAVAKVSLTSALEKNMIYSGAVAPQVAKQAIFRALCNSFNSFSAWTSQCKEEYRLKLCSTKVWQTILVLMHIRLAHWSTMQATCLSNRCWIKRTLTLSHSSISSRLMLLREEISNKVVQWLVRRDSRRKMHGRWEQRISWLRSRFSLMINTLS